MATPRVEVSLYTTDDISYRYLVFINGWQINCEFPAGDKESANTFLDKFEHALQEVVKAAYDEGREDFKRSVKDMLS